MDFNNASSIFGTIPNTTNNTIQVHLDERNGWAVYLVGLYIAIFGICGNSLVIVVFFKSKDLRSSSKTISMKTIFHLTVTDLLTMIGVGIASVLLLLDENMSYYACSITVSFPMYMTMVTQSVLFIVTLDRHIAICYQHKYTKLMKNRSLNILFALAWFVPFPLSFSSFIGYNHWDGFQTCIPRYMFQGSIFIGQSVFFVLLMVLTLALYVPILLKAREFNIKTSPAQLHGVNARTMKLKAKKQTIRGSFFIRGLTIVFLICNFPFTIVRFQYGSGYTNDIVAFKTTFFLGIMNSVVNPFLYAWQKQIFRQAAIETLKCKGPTQEVTEQSVLGDRPFQQEQHPLSLRSPYASGSGTQKVVLKREGEVGKNVTNENKFHGITRRKVINVKPYHHFSIAESSL